MYDIQGTIYIVRGTIYYIQCIRNAFQDILKFVKLYQNTNLEIHGFILENQCSTFLCFFYLEKI